jgi:hypothetical protein
MVFESGPNKGSMINYLTGVDVADRMKKELNSEMRAHRKRNAFLEDQLNSQYAELAKYDDLQLHEESVSNLEKLDSENEKHEKVIKLLEDLKLKRERLGQVSKSAENIQAWLKEASNVAAMVKQQDTNKSLLEACQSVSRLKAVTGATLAYKAALDCIKTSSEEIEESAQKIKFLEEYVREHGNLLKTIKSVTIKHSQTLEELKGFDGLKCPVCEGKIDARSICSMH